MGFEQHRVSIGPATVGWVGYCTASDTWHEAVKPTPSDIVRSDGWTEPFQRCSHPPDVATGGPHSLVMADVTDGYETWPTLYCPKCRAVVLPPHDGYAYLEYPAEWLSAPCRRGRPAGAGAERTSATRPR